MKSKPNILVFMTDQQRGDTVINRDIFTPNLDELMENGVTFSNTYCLLRTVAHPELLF